IARHDGAEEGQYRFVGGGRQQTKGFSGGAITDLEGLERTVRLALEDAERQAGERIDSVYMAVSGPKVACRLASAAIDLGSRPVGARDVSRVLSAAMSKDVDKTQDVLSADTVAFKIDDQDGVRDPRGLHGRRLGSLVSVASAPKTLMRNLEECLVRADLKITGVAPAPLAAAAGVLVQDEIENGAICVDMGAGLTSACVYINGGPAWIGCAPSGGRHVTSDIAQGVGTTFAAAERLKILHGSVDPDGPGSAERIEAPRLGDDGRLEAARMSKGDLASIIAPRIEETFELLQRVLDQSDLRRVLPRRIVLTGGASQIKGAKEVAARVFRAPVRLARPVSADILGEAHAGPAFSTAAGLLSLCSQGPTEAMRAGRALGGAGDGDAGIVNRTYVWLKENF
ncbi:MAG: cell division protein FtsA, partial [Pseudomonadota bacterium]